MKLKDMDITELASLYGVACDICKEYSRMTDGYVLATGVNVLDSSVGVPNEIQETIKERQEYFAIKDKITKELKKRLLTDIEYE